MMQDFVQEVVKTVREHQKGIHTFIPGKIISFDPDKCQATVLPLMKFKKPDNTLMDYPQITGVPVWVLQSMGQNATVAMPVKPNDECLLVVAEQSLDLWMYGQQTETDLKFDLSNAICIHGLFSNPNGVTAEACSENAIILDVDSNTRIKIKNGLVRVDSPQLVLVYGNEKIELNVSGTKITIVNGVVTIDSPEVIINGNLTINGELTEKGEL